MKQRRPQESRQFAGYRNDGLRRLLPACGQVALASVQPLLSFVGDGDHDGRLTVSALFERGTDVRGMAIVPRRLDEQPGVRGSCPLS